MKYHTVAWCSTAIYSWGLHAGQLGHDRSDEKYVITPKQIPNFCSSNSEIVMVAGSTGATAFVTSAGDIYVLHEYKCRKVAGKYAKNVASKCVISLCGFQATERNTIKNYWG